jgi:hypothetical protein
MRAFWTSGYRLLIGYTAVLILLVPPARLEADCGLPTTCHEAGLWICEFGYCRCSDTNSFVATCYLCESEMLWVIDVTLWEGFIDCSIECGQAQLGHCID